MTSAGLQQRRFGVHLTLDDYCGSPDRLCVPSAVRAWLEELPEILGMIKLVDPLLVEVGRCSERDTGGITCFVLIAESHISIHTLPGRRFASADLYMCQQHLDKDWLLEYFRAVFVLESIEHNMIIRGTQHPLHDIHDNNGKMLPDQDAGCGEVPRPSTSGSGTGGSHRCRVRATRRRDGRSCRRKRLAETGDQRDQ